MTIRCVRFELCDNTNYSAKFLSSRRTPSPQTSGKHHHEDASITSKAYQRFSMSVYFKRVEKIFKSPHKKVPNTSSSTVTDSMEQGWKSARRNAIDFGPRPRYNGTPFSLFVDTPATLREIKRENARLQDLHDRGYLGDDEKDVRTAARKDEFPRKEDSAPEEPFQEDVRTLGHILAWMHSEGINAAGFPTTEGEKEDCENARCRCLGPMMRDV